jgi:two-component system chemotaxis sensor kinase CheA
MSDYLDPNNEELLKDFFIEAEAQVDSLEQNILVLENDPGDRDSIDEIFRAAHTLKGAAATVQMTGLAEFTHLVEDVLDGIRSAEVTASEEVIDVLLNSIDVIKDMLSAARDGIPYEDDIDGLKGSLRSLLDGGTSQKTGPGGAARSESRAAAEGERPSEDVWSGRNEASSVTGALSEYDLLELHEAAEEGETVYQVRVEFNEDHPMNTIGGIQVYAALKDLGTVLKTEPDFELLYEDNFFPVVYYYLSSPAEPGAVKAKISISDVVLNSTVTAIDTLGPGTAIGGAPSKETVTRRAETSKAQKAASKEAPARETSGEKAHVKELHKGPIAVSGGFAKAPGGSAEGAGRKAEEEHPRQSSEGEKAEGKKPLREQELRKGSSGGSVLRVDSKRIDNLLNMVSEAVITKAAFNQISGKFNFLQNEMGQLKSAYYERLRDLFDRLPLYLERIQGGETVKKIKEEILERFGDMYSLFDPVENKLKATVNEFNATAQNLSRNTSDLQEGVMQIRMVPISQIFSRFPRLVRDVSKDIGKKVDLEIQGGDTELDKSVIEDLLDPLIHCVRNAVDHGVEIPEERIAAGKTPEGHVLLKASNEGNMIIIEISDDGRGINVESVHAKAVERGLIHPNKKLSDIEAFNLIFEPGFSTAKQVTNLSGRGVGLDVVKKQIEKLNGNVSVWSEQGRGSRITIKIPLTLAIIQGLLIRVGQEIYAIPITSVIDSHRINADDVKMIDNYEVFNVREDVVSLLRLNRLFGISTREEGEKRYVVVVGSGEKKMGLMVDSLIGEEDVVIKPLKDRYTNTPGIAGATILGDGMVALIIDVSQLLDLGLRREIENRNLRSAQIT